MSPDIDELLRTTMRRHASDAPTAIDLDAVRARSQAITRRRRFEAVAAVVTTLVVLLGLGYAAGQLRTEATPVEPVPSDGLPWTAFPTFDPNGKPTGTTSMVVHAGAENHVVATTGRGAAPIGWYGEGARTLVYTSGGEGVRESTLVSVTVSEDGRQVSVPAELDVPGTGTITGRAFQVRGRGPIVWVPDGTLHRGRLVQVSRDLRSATTLALPVGEPLFVTASVVGLGSSESRRIEVVSTSTGEVTGSFTMCPQPNYQVAVSLDGTHVAISCGDGTVQLVRLGGPENPRLAAVPGAAGRGGFLGLWFDTEGGLHASTTPEMRPDYTQVDDYDYNGVGWDPAGHDVLTRVFPAAETPVDLAYHAQKWASTPHWVVTHPHETDLGETTGAGIAFRTDVPPSPTPTPSVSARALPAAPDPVPWTASVVDHLDEAPPREEVVVTIDGRSRQVDSGANAQTELAGWTGPDRRTLVWGTTQDYRGDQEIFTATFSAEGTMTAGPSPLRAPDDGTALAGRPFVLADGRLAVWRIAQAPGGAGVQGTLYRFSSDLRTATRQQLPVGEVVFVTSQYVGVQPVPAALKDAAKAAQQITVVSADGTTQKTDTVGTCGEGFDGSVDPNARFVAVSCRGADVTIVSLPPDPALGTALTPLKPLPGSATVLATWFDSRGGVRVSSRDAQGRVDDFAWAADLVSSGDWVLTPTQGVAYASYVDGYAVQLVAERSTDFLVPGTWTTGTDPSLELGRGTGPGSLVARPSG